jgi:hypothetical protein
MGGKCKKLGYSGFKDFATEKSSGTRDGVRLVFATNHPLEGKVRWSIPFIIYAFVPAMRIRSTFLSSLTYVVYLYYFS